MTDLKVEDLENSIEQRADFIQADKLLDETSKNDLFEKIVASLLKKQITLIVGPRGCGKTHMMRYASLICVGDRVKPLSIYVSLNRYYRLEPLLTSRVNAFELFHCWVLSSIILSVCETLKEYVDTVSYDKFIEEHSLDVDAIYKLVCQLEKGSNLDESELNLSKIVGVSYTKNLIEKARIVSGRKRAVLLLDDAALTLTPEYMKEFFDIFRTLKSTHISPKASVYPGTTEYGSRFHPTQEGDFCRVWLSVEDPMYSNTMEGIAKIRVTEFDNISQEVNEFIKYASFGIPRAYLSMLQEFQSMRSQNKTTQQALNSIVQQHILARKEEFNSISLKSPKLKSVIECGNTVFDKICSEIKLANNKEHEKQIMIGVSKVNENPHVERMFNLLIEAGLLYEIPSKVSHGGREYSRYIPHLAGLFNLKLFVGVGTGYSPQVAVRKLKLPSTKHPLRRTVSTLMGKELVSRLKIDLPPCSSCGTERISQSQRFCHQCGSELVDVSSFESCMALPFCDVPGLTEWQRNKIRTEIIKFKTIGDFLSSQDPSSELLRAKRIGKVRAKNIINLATAFVDEFLQ